MTTLADARRQSQVSELASTTVAAQAEAARLAAVAAQVYASERAVFRAGRRHLRTKAQPPLFWRPRRLSRAMEDQLDAQEGAMHEELKARERELALKLLTPSAGSSSSSASARRE